MFFGGLFLAYTVYRNLYPDAFAAASHHLDWKLGGDQHRGPHRQQPDHGPGRARGRARPPHARSWPTCSLTVVLGSVFLGVKVVEYADKFEHHLVPGAQLPVRGRRSRAPAQIFYSLYFAMTGLHALHMIIGIPILLDPGLAGAPRAATGPRTTRRWR